MNSSEDYYTGKRISNNLRNVSRRRALSGNHFAHGNPSRSVSESRTYTSVSPIARKPVCPNIKVYLSLVPAGVREAEAALASEGGDKVGSVYNSPTIGDSEANICPILPGHEALRHI